MNGVHVLQVVVKAPNLAHVCTVVGHHAQAVQQKLITVKVCLLWLTQIFSFLMPQICNQDEGAWTDWGDWSLCSAACGAGSQTRSRGYSAGLPCTGDSTQTLHCYGGMANIFYLK